MFRVCVNIPREQKSLKKKSNYDYKDSVIKE